MSQLAFPLLADTAVARRVDPVTSHIAAREITESGQRSKQQMLVFAYVRQLPGHTSAELAREAQRRGCSDLNRWDFARRLPELAWNLDKAGRRINPLVYKGEKRRCGVTGKLAITWYAL